MVKYVQPLQIGSSAERSSSPVPRLEGINFHDVDQDVLYYWNGTGWVAHETSSRVKISSGDQTPDYLVNKLIAGTGIVISQLDPGSNETLEISVSGAGGESVSGNTLQVTKESLQTRTVLHEELLSSSQAAFNISNIPQTYDHLELILVGRSTNSTEVSVLISFNSDTTATNYRLAFHQAGSSHTVAVSDDRIIGNLPGTGAPTDTFASHHIFIPGYRQPIHKTAMALINRRISSTTNTHHIRNLFWENISSISSIDFTLSSGDFDSNSYIQLVGIKEEMIVVDILGGNNAYSEEDVSNPPTDAEIDSAFGIPSVVGSGFIGLINDAGLGTNAYVVGSDGSNWWYQAMTKAV